MSDTISKKILVVDDEIETLVYISKMLQRDQYEVISTTKGEEALGLAERLLPDLIILDMAMPDMDGGKVAAILSRKPSTANIPIIFLTGLLIKKEPILEKIRGKHYIMAKPVTSQELLTMVRNVLVSE